MYSEFSGKCWDIWKEIRSMQEWVELERTTPCVGRLVPYGFSELNDQAVRKIVLSVEHNESSGFYVSLYTTDCDDMNDIRETRFYSERDKAEKVFNTIKTKLGRDNMPTLPENMDDFLYRLGFGAPH